MRVFIPIVLAATIAAAIPSVAIADDDMPPKAYGELVACRNIAEAAARLDCYDKATAEIERARSANELVLIDKAGIRKTKRSLFGFTLPNLPFFGDKEGNKEAVEELQTSFASLRALGYGKWQFTIPEGGIWQTTEALNIQPKPGQEITLKKGMAGGYWLRIGKGIACRVKRVG